MNRVRIKLDNEQRYFDTFRNEEITYTKKTIDFEKPDKVINDFSSSFTLPASPNNNALFGHYYAVDFGTPFNPYKKNQAEIWVGNELWSIGALQLQSVKMENGKPSNYKVQFYSDVVNLKAALNGLTIDKLGWQDKNHNISISNMTTYLTGTEINGMRYPMASAESLWRWSGSTEENTRNIISTGDGVLNRELRPAIKVSEVTQRIFDAAGYEYEVDFAAESYWIELYMWANNAKKIGTNPPFSKVGLSNTNAITLTEEEIKTLLMPTEFKDEQNMYNPTTGVFTIPNSTTYSMDISLNGISPVEYAISINGSVGAYNTMPVNTTISLGALTQGDRVKVLIKNPVPKGTGGDRYNTGRRPAEVTIANVAVYTTTASALDTMDVGSVMPKMSCEEFLRGILNTFNAIIYWDKVNEKYIIKERDAWLASGNEYDLSKDVDISSAIIEPPTGYKEFAFKMADGKDYANELFKANNSKEYGEAIAQTGNYFGGQYINQNPFVPSVWQEVVTVDAYGEATTESRVCAFNCVSSDGKAVESGVRLMYYQSMATATSNLVVADFNGNKDVPFNQYQLFRNFNSTSEVNLTYSEEYSFHNAKVTTVSGAPFLRSDTLYTKFYRDYINEIYNPNRRRNKVSLKLPFGVATLIQPNDKITINKQAYRIEEINVKLLSGDVSLKLITTDG